MFGHAVFVIIHHPFDLAQLGSSSLKGWRRILELGLLWEVLVIVISSPIIIIIIIACSFFLFLFSCPLGVAFVWVVLMSVFGLVASYALG